jgi:DNA-binding NtrC family response regulator
VLITGDREPVRNCGPITKSARGFPFVAINCAAIRNALESEIFRTGERSPRVRPPAGMLKADRGTLFLDEIGDDAGGQVKLLRVLQERRFRRLGGHNSRPSTCA